MGFLLQVLGPALAAVGGAVASAAPVASAAASVGTGVYGAVKSAQKPPDPMEVERQRQARIAQQLQGTRGKTGSAATTLTGVGGDLSTAPVGKRTLLGG